MSTSSSEDARSCPPTARSPSVATASSTSDPLQMPTALSNSANTAIGTSLSDFDIGASGLSDTSAGSNRASSTETSQETVLSDFRRNSSTIGGHSRLAAKKTKTSARKPLDYRFTGSFGALVPVPNKPETSVYDVAELSSARRGLAAPRAPRVAPAPVAREKPTFGNKIVVIGATQDGKSQIQMTIDMQIVGVAATQLVPKKVIVGGESIPVDSKSENE